MPDVSIVIPTYNHLDDALKPCLESIRLYTDLATTEIIVVANGCIDGTRQYVESLGHPFKLLWFDQPLGYPCATNEGILAARGNYVILLNNDTILLKQERNGWVDILRRPFVNDPKLAITGVTRLFCHFSRYYFIIFFCAMVKRSVFNDVGLLDELMSPGFGEDIDFAIRCQNAGYTIQSIRPDAEIWEYSSDYPLYHHGEQTVTQIPDWSYINNRNNMILKERHRKPTEYTILILAPDVPELLQRCVRSIRANTDYTETEIIILIDPNSPSMHYAQLVSQYGPYSVFNNGEGAAMAAIASGGGKYLVVLDGKAQLIGTNNNWLKRSTLPFYRNHVEAVSPVLVDGRAAKFCFTCKRERMLQYLSLEDAIQNLQAVQSDPSGYFPIFYPYPI